MWPRCIRYLGSRQGRKELKYALARKIFNPVLRPLGYTLVADHFYQPIPSDSELLIYKDMMRPLCGLELNIEEQIDFVRRIFGAYREEFNDSRVLSRYGYDGKTGFSNGDPQLLYSIVRHVKPGKIVEVVAAALAVNAAEGAGRTKVVSIDPYPKAILRRLKAEARCVMDFSLISQPVQTVEPSLFASLESGDILFVDSSHVFKQGSDVEYEFLMIYPFLKKGVILHLHDIFLPFDYPLDWNKRNYKFWNEQYFLEVFLQGSDQFRILAASSMIAHHDPSIFADTVAGFDPSRVPGSFWMVAQR